MLNNKQFKQLLEIYIEFETEKLQINLHTYKYYILYYKNI